MTFVTAPVPATPLEAAIQDVRVAQGEYDEATENHQRLSMEVAESRLHRDASETKVNDARQRMYEAVVKPQQYTTHPVRVLPVYREEETPQLEEGVDAAWSEKGPDA